MPTDLEQSIIKTLAFFDIFDYPLTLTEVWKWLYKPGKINNQNPKLSDVKEVLETSRFLQSKISQVEGFYALSGREASYLIRKQCNNLAEYKFNRAVRLIKFYKYLPFIKMIAICNSLAYSNSREEGDIDFFIITSKDKMWLARFLVICFVKLLHKRPTCDKKRNTFDFSFFIDERFLNIKDVMFSQQGDIYYPYWLEQLMPIYNPQNFYQKFLTANQWYKDYLPNGLSNQFTLEVKDHFLSRLIKGIWGFILQPPFLGSLIKNLIRKFQTRIIDQNLRELVNIDTRVVINDKMLKFHSNDRREVFYKKWKEASRQLLEKK